MTLDNPYKPGGAPRDEFAKKRSELQIKFTEIEKQKQVMEDQKAKTGAGISALTDELLRIQGEFRLLEELANEVHKKEQEEKK